MLEDRFERSYEQAMQHGARLETVLDNLDTQIHVTRPETGEILFINKALREANQLNNLDLSTTTCWAILGENKECICECCPYEELKRRPNSKCEWDVDDPATGRSYHNVSFLVEWGDGSQVYMCQTIDITETRQLLSTLERQVTLQQLQAQIAMEASQHTRLDAIADSLLASTAAYLGMDRAFLLTLPKSDAPFALTSEWCAPQVPSLSPALDGLQLPELREEFAPLRSQSTLVFDEPELLPPELQRVGGDQLQNLLILPLRMEGALWGLLCYAMHRRAHAWDQQEMAILHTVCGIFGSAVRRIHAEQRRAETQRELEEAIVLAENASGAKSDFLSRMSHEIRTPMNVIIGMCRMALRSEDPEKIQHSLNQIDVSAKHLLGLINDILDVSKIEANKFELHDEPFDLEHVLMNVSNTVMVRAEERKQTIQILLARGMPRRFIGDSMRLAQVFTNLFTNAIKFSPEGGNIVLSMQELERDGNTCTLEARVRDHGIGMTPEQLSRLFTSFEQADGGIARKYGGTGLGLAICKSIVNMMAGDIHAESEPGKGSTFIFTVKLALAPFASEDAHAEKKLPHTLRVLVVDDEEQTRAYFADIMAGFGVACEQAASGEEALALLESGAKYDILFVDWRMPGMDGVETVRRLRARAGEQMLVVMISSADLSEVKDEATRAGVQHFVSKPLFPSSLFNVISRILYSNTDAPHGEKGKGGLSDVPDLHAYRVLLVEDMEFNREVACAMLEETGCAIDEAESGLQAVEMFRKDPTRYGCILMDMQMPEMDGLEATRTIRAEKHPWAQKVPIIAMTANVFRDDVEQCLAAGMDDHIGKPIVDHTLYEKLAFYMHANATLSASEPAPAPEAAAPQESPEVFLPFIGIEGGLARLRGNRKLFATLLVSFQKNTKYAEMCAEIAQKHYEDAALSAHALKGIAANIELVELLRLVVETEAALKSGNAPTEELLAELRKANEQTLALLPRVIQYLSHESA